MYKNISCLFAILLLMVFNINAQTITPSVQPAQGGYFTGAGRQLEWTIGQPLGSTFSNSGYEISLGFQQPEVNIKVGTISGSPFCAATQISISFTATGFFNSANVFTAQLSDASGSFATPVNIGTDTGKISGTITATIPAVTPGGSGYKVRVVSSSPVFYESIVSMPPVTTITGKASVAFTVLQAPVLLTPYATDFVLCSGSTTQINVPNSQPGIHYKFKMAGVAIDSIVGNGYNIATTTIAISKDTLFTVVAKDTTNGCSVTLIPAVKVVIGAAPDTPVFFVGDTVLPVDSVSTYAAFSKNCIHITYKIDSGGAVIDSISGVVSSVTSSFLVKATAVGLSACATSTNTLFVKVGTGGGFSREGLQRSACTSPWTPPGKEWQFTGGNALGEDWLLKIKQASDGGYIAVGYAHNESDGGTYPSILKLDNNGKPQWHKIYTTGIFYGNFNDVVETYTAGVSTGYAAVAEAKIISEPGNYRILIVKYDLNGNELQHLLINNSTYFGGTGTTSAYHMQQIPNGSGAGNFVISGWTNTYSQCFPCSTTWNPTCNRQDLLLLEVNNDLSIGSPVMWAPYHKGEGCSNAGSWTGRGFVIDNITLSGSVVTSYDVTIVGSAFKAPFISPALSNNDLINGATLFAAGALSYQQSYLVMDKINVNNSGSTATEATGWPQKYDLDDPTDLTYYHSYTALCNPPFNQAGTPGHTSIPSVENYKQSQWDEAMELVKDNSGNFVVLGAINKFWPGSQGGHLDLYLTGGPSSGEYPINPSPNAHNFDDYKDNDVVLFKTDLGGNFITNTAVQVMHASGEDFRMSLQRDPSGNVYVESTTADNAKNHFDGIDNLTTRVYNKFLNSATSATPISVAEVAHVGKYDANFNALWEFTISGELIPQDFGSANTGWAYDECAFSMALNDEGGFVVAGNNCRRGDDYVVHKFYPDCELDPNNYIYYNGWTLPATTTTLNGTGLGTVRVKGKVVVPATANITLSNYTLEFANTRLLNDMADRGFTFQDSWGTETYSSTPLVPTWIEIQPGGSLTLDNCTLKGIDDCNGNPMQWDGIIVLGDPTQSTQSSATQGKLVMENGTTLQDAIFGVDADGRFFAPQSNDIFLWGLCDDYAYNGTGKPFTSQTDDGWAVFKQVIQSSDRGGGIIQATGTSGTNCNFINCPTGIGFAEFGATNTSFFKYCTFNVNSYMAEPVNRKAGLNWHMFLSGVNWGTNELIQHCTFDNTYYTNFSADKRGIGILDFNSQYNIGNPADGSDITTIQDLTTGVEHENLFSSGQLACVNAVINNNQNGINIINTTNDYINNCTFNIPGYSSSFPNYSVGLGTYNANLFIVCGNAFNGASSGSNTLVGSFIQNANTTENILDNNSYNLNVMGIQTSLNNNALFYRQNSFTDNLIAVNLNADGLGATYSTLSQTGNNTGGVYIPLDVFNSGSGCGGGANYELALGEAYTNGSPYQYNVYDIGSPDVTKACSGYWYGGNITIPIPSTDTRLNVGTLTGGLPTNPLSCGSTDVTCLNCKMNDPSNPKKVSMHERASVLRSILSDTTTVKNTSTITNKLNNAVSYLEHFNDWDAQQLLVPAYLQLGYLDKMNVKLNSIREQSQDARDFISIYSLLGNVKATTRNYNQMNENEWGSLRSFAKANQSPSGAVARNLLFHYKNEYYPTVPPKVKIQINSVKETSDISIENGDKLIIYPNPNNGNATIQYILQDDTKPGTIVIMDLLGNTISSIAVSNTYGEITINKSELGAGIYFCKLVQGYKNIGVQKFVKY